MGTSLGVSGNFTSMKNPVVIVSCTPFPCDDKFNFREGLKKWCFWRESGDKSFSNRVGERGGFRFEKQRNTATPSFQDRDLATTLKLRSFPRYMRSQVMLIHSGMSKTKLQKNATGQISLSRGDFASVPKTFHSLFWKVTSSQELRSKSSDDKISDLWKTDENIWNLQFFSCVFSIWSTGHAITKKVQILRITDIWWKTAKSIWFCAPHGENDLHPVKPWRGGPADPTPKKYQKLRFFRAVILQHRYHYAKTRNLLVLLRL